MTQNTVSAPIRDERPIGKLDRQQNRLAHSDHIDCKKWLNDGDGLQDRGITRDLNWGVPVKKGDADWSGMEAKYSMSGSTRNRIYRLRQEWVDAGKGTDWERWWRTDKGADDVTYNPIHGQG